MFKLKILNTIWVVNGIAFFFLVIFGVLYLVFETFPKLFEEDYEYSKGLIVGQKQEKAAKLGIDLQHVTYDAPQKIPFSNYLYSSVRILDKEIPQDALNTLASANDASLDLFGGTINIIFYDEAKNEAWALLEDYGFIGQTILPRYYRNKAKDRRENMNYILYEISLEDTNGDLRINGSDSSAYFISGLDGRNLKRITPLGLELDHYWLDHNYEKIYFDNIVTFKDKDELGTLLKARRIYTYDLRLDKFLELQKLQHAFDDIQKKFRNSK